MIDERTPITDHETEIGFPFDKCIHTLFERQVHRTPDAIALAIDDQAISYQELNRRSNQLAHGLRRLGVKPETLVGISLERSPEMIVGVLGVLKAGGAYLPLDPAYPRKRLALILDEAQAKVLLSRRRLINRLPISHTPVMCLDSEWDTIRQESDENPINASLPENLAYVIYTSGSTGRPKGVLIEHRGVCNLVQAQIRAFGIQPESRVLQFASFSFDASVSEIFTALLAGARLCLAAQEALMPGPDLIRTLRTQAIDVVTLPPSVLAVLSSEALPDLKTVVSAGEACTASLVARWAAGRRFINAYGPTEATVCATLAECTAGDCEPSIGRPMANVRLYLLDSNMQPVPDGEPGEIFVGGIGLARGYLDRPDLTAERFLPNPFSSLITHHSSLRIYKTGDRAYRLPDGSLVFIGRDDDQVKVRGFRIELGEVETTLRRHPAVRQAAVTAPIDASGDRWLVAYVVIDARRKASIHELRNFLKDKLPDYMLPAHVVQLDAMPLTASGKIDRCALPPPDGERPALDEAFEAPHTPIEAVLARIWAEVLGVERIGLNDNFFDLGGHSLLATQVLSRVSSTFRIEVPLSVLLSLTPTVAATSRAVESYIIEQAETDALADALRGLDDLSDERVQAALAGEASSWEKAA